MENILKSEEKAGNIYKPTKFLGNRNMLALTSAPFSLQSLGRPPLPPNSVLLPFVCLHPFGSEHYLTLPYCISLKEVTSCPPSPNLLVLVLSRGPK